MRFNSVFLIFMQVIALFSSSYASTNVDLPHTEIYKDKLAISSSSSQEGDHLIRTYYFYNNNSLTYGMTDLVSFKALDEPKTLTQTLNDLFMTNLVDGRKGLLSKDHLIELFPSDDFVPSLKAFFDSDSRYIISPLESDFKPGYLAAIRTDMLSKNAFDDKFEITSEGTKQFKGVLFNRRATKNYNAPALIDDMTLWGAAFMMAVKSVPASNSKVVDNIKKYLNEDTYCAVVGASTAFKIIAETVGDTATSISGLIDDSTVTDWNQIKGNYATFLGNVPIPQKCQSFNKKVFEESDSKLETLAAIGSDEIGFKKYLLSDIFINHKMQNSGKVLAIIEAASFIHEISNAYQSLENQDSNFNNEGMSLDDFPQLAKLVIKIAIKAYLEEYANSFLSSLSGDIQEAFTKKFTSYIETKLKANAAKIFSTANFLNIAYGQLYGELFTPEKIYFDVFLDDNGVPRIETGNIINYYISSFPLIMGDGTYDNLLSFDSYDYTHHLYPSIEEEINERGDKIALLSQPILVKQGYQAEISSDLFFEPSSWNLDDFFTGPPTQTAVETIFTESILGKDVNTGEIKWFDYAFETFTTEFQDVGNLFKSIGITGRTFDDSQDEQNRRLAGSKIPLMTSISLANIGSFKYNFHTEVFNGLDNSSMSTVTKSFEQQNDFRFYVLPNYSESEFLAGYNGKNINGDKDFNYDEITGLLFISQNLAQRTGGFYRESLKDGNMIWQLRAAYKRYESDGSMRYLEISYNDLNYFTGTHPDDSSLPGMFLKIPPIYFDNHPSLDLALYDPVLSAFADVEGKNLDDIVTTLIQKQNQNVINEKNLIACKIHKDDHGSINNKNFWTLFLPAIISKAPAANSNNGSYMRIHWFLDGQSKKVIPENFEGEIVQLDSWWGNHGLKIDINNTGVFDYTNDDTGYRACLDNLDTCVDAHERSFVFTNGFSLQDFNLWEGYWTDPTHGDITCYATGCPYNPNGAGVTFRMENIDEFQCINNEWTHKGITLKDTSGNVIYCRQFNTCGDRNIDGDEECDDGNRLEGDGCSIDCKNE